MLMLRRNWPTQTYTTFPMMPLLQERRRRNRDFGPVIPRKCRGKEKGHPLMPTTTFPATILDNLVIPTVHVSSTKTSVRSFVIAIQTVVNGPLDVDVKLNVIPSSAPVTWLSVNVTPISALPVEPTSC